MVTGSVTSTLMAGTDMRVSTVYPLEAEDESEDMRP